MKSEKEKILEKVTPAMIASMLWKEKEQEYADTVITADQVLPELEGLIKGLIFEHVKEEDALMDLKRYLEDYLEVNKEFYFSLGVQIGAKLMKELAFG